MKDIFENIFEKQLKMVYHQKKNNNNTCISSMEIYENEELINMFIGIDAKALCSILIGETILTDYRITNPKEE